MTDCAGCTHVRRPGRSAAVAWLVAWTLMVAACFVAVRSSTRFNSFAESLPETRGDIRLYWDVVRRVRDGEAYYPAMHAELNRQAYPTSSVFNWRTPPVLWLMARLSGPIDGPTIILGAATALIAAGFLIQKRDLGSTGAYVGAFLVLGAVLPCFVSEVCVLPLEWGAIGIGLSLCCFAGKRTGMAVLLGMLAAFFSELTLGYAVLMAVWAAGTRQWREVRMWAIGLVVFAGCFAWHAAMVADEIGTHGVMHSSAWWQFCGLPFLVATTRMNCWLLTLPAWLAAIYLPTALLGLAHWKSAMGIRCGLLAAAYSLLFLCIGQPFNQYWGLVLAPPLAWGAARGPRALFELWHAARWRPAGGRASLQVS